jgi:hypothetical protein
MEDTRDAVEYTTLSKLGITAKNDCDVALCPQQSHPWFSLRLGCLTGSKADKLFKLDGTRKTSAKTLANELILERLTEVPVAQAAPSYPIERGNECEKLAKITYFLERDVKPIEVGYIIGERGAYGCSPDGLLPPDRGLEIKARMPAAHLVYLRDKKLTPADFLQVQFDMWVCGLAKWEFYAFWPTGHATYAAMDTADGAPVLLDLPSWHTVVEADEKLHAAFDKRVGEFCEEVDEEYKKIKATMGG